MTENWDPINLPLGAAIPAGTLTASLILRYHPTYRSHDPSQRPRGLCDELMEDLDRADEPET